MGIALLESDWISVFHMSSKLLASRKPSRIAVEGPARNWSQSHHPREICLQVLNLGCYELVANGIPDNYAVSCAVVSEARNEPSQLTAWYPGKGGLHRKSWWGMNMNMPCGTGTGIKDWSIVAKKKMCKQCSERMDRELTKLQIKGKSIKPYRQITITNPKYSLAMIKTKDRTHSDVFTTIQITWHFIFP